MPATSSQDAVDSSTTTNNGNVAAETATASIPAAPPTPPYQVSRRVLLQANVNAISEYERRETKLINRVRSEYQRFSCVALLLSVMPVLKWLPRYSVRDSLAGDVMAGITVAVMHIPQGMAYGLLAGVSPSSGLYMAVFPTIVYFLFGTSRHISVGTLSVVSVMVLKVVQTYASAPLAAGDVANATILATTTTTTMATPVIPALPEYTANQVVTACAFVCGIQMVLMSVLQLGNLASLLSESLVNGFTTGTAIHVLSSQLKDMFGLRIVVKRGYFQVINTFIDFCRKLPQTNLVTLSITIFVIAFMILMNEILKPIAARHCRFPIPAELMAVIGGTLVSYLLDLGGSYGVHLVGSIPLGFPVPELPPVPLMLTVAVDSIAISIVSFSVTISMAMILAQKQNYDVRANQEMLAMGLSNLVGGLFSCVPNGTSLSRSLIQELTGGRTQVASVVSAALITAVLLWIAPVFQVLPRCVLSGIIVVALKGMYMQAGELRRFHRESCLNSATWLVTFVACVAIDVTMGLLAGILCSLIALYMKGWRSASYQLGSVPGTDLYANLETNAGCRPVAGVCIFRYVGAINFASANGFRERLYGATRVTQKTLRRASMLSTGASMTAVTEAEGGDEKSKLLGPLHTVVVDLSGVTHMDVAGVKTCCGIERDLRLLDVAMVMAAPNERVFDALQHADWLEIGAFVVLPSVHDAVLYARGLVVASTGDERTKLEGDEAATTDDKAVTN